MAGIAMRGALWFFSKLVMGIVVCTMIVLLLVPEALYDWNLAIGSYVTVTGIVFLASLLALSQKNWLLKKVVTACIVSVLTILFLIPDVEVSIFMFFDESFWSSLMAIFCIVVVGDIAAQVVTGIGEEDEIQVEEYRGYGQFS